MARSTPTERDPDATRACAWQHRAQVALCDVQEPWAHGTLMRASAHPTYHDYNIVWVADEPGESAQELIALADRAQAALGHRRVDFADAAAADARAAGFAAAGWSAQRIVYLRYEGPPAAADPRVAAVDYDAAAALRAAWLHEDYPTLDFAGFAATQKAVALALGTETLAIHDGGDVIAFAEIERDGDGAEVSSVYVAADRRGRGLGTTLTTAAIHAAGGAGDVWINADDEDRPKHLYIRLGFRPVWTMVKYQRLLGS